MTSPGFPPVQKLALAATINTTNAMRMTNTVPLLSTTLSLSSGFTRAMRPGAQADIGRGSARRAVDCTQDLGMFDFDLDCRAALAGLGAVPG
jgi:hypothetical protein